MLIHFKSSKKVINKSILKLTAKVPSRAIILNLSRCFNSDRNMWQLFGVCYRNYYDEYTLKVSIVHRTVQSCSRILSFHPNCLLDNFLWFRCRSGLYTPVEGGENYPFNHARNGLLGRLIYCLLVFLVPKVIELPPVRNRQEKFRRPWKW